MARRYRKTTTRRSATVDEVSAVGIDIEQRMLWLGEFVERNLRDEAELDRAAGELTTLLYLQFVYGGGIEIVPDQIVDVADVAVIQGALRDILRGLAPGGSV